MQIQGKIVAITGAGSGMGAESAAYLSNKGAHVALLDLDVEAAKRVAARTKGLAIRCNVANEEEAAGAVEKVIAELGIPHVLINCAGIAPAKRIVGRAGPMPLGDFQQVIAVNLVGTFNMLRLVAAAMMNNAPVNDDQERGVIINTASIAAQDGQIGQSAYSASKGGVCALTLPAAREFAQFGIRVMTIAPGLFQTPLVAGLSPAVQTTLTSQIPFPQRLGHVNEFALLVAQVIENPYLNGEVIRLDGALRMQPN